MLAKIESNIEKYNMISKGDHIVIGLSGGADSICLTHVLYSMTQKYDIKLTAVHVNHCLRGEDAQVDERYVGEFCSKFGIDLKVYTKDIKTLAKKTGKTLEEAGRDARYAAFYETLNEVGANKIAVAHNMNDNAETVLMRLCRGTGIKGLGGISPTRDNIIRPIIGVTREEIEKYCDENLLKYQTDYTNNIDIYTRNKIRIHLIPWIQANLNNSIIQTLFKSSELMREEDLYLDKLAKEGFANCGGKSSYLDVEKLAGYDVVLQRRIVRLACVRYSEDLHDISYKHVESVLGLINKETGKSVNLPNELMATREYQNIRIHKKEVVSNGFCYEVEIDKKLYVKEIDKTVLVTGDKKNNENFICTNAFDYDKIDSNLTLRTRKNGDKIYFASINGTKMLKKWFTDKKIPQNERNNIPLLCKGSEVLFIPENVFSGYYLADSKTKNILYFYIWEGNTNEGNT